MRRDGTIEAYDLSRDPGERNDLYGREDFSDLEVVLRRWIETNRALAGKYAPGQDVDLDEATVERLRELGYIE